ncbi:hypothetical protein [Chryseobacterium gregarium]|uniref:hypothetical protein n=1 Tax=Chryseobacterium gregarium TaxID=456299 RepID=UPI00042A19ED|nr:hypothetical protein [Chryseobacterium gregarium]
MKKAIFVTTVLSLITVTGCTKSETQYKDRDNQMQTVNDPASDTIRTLQEESDTVHSKGKPQDIQTDNE